MQAASPIASLIANLTRSQLSNVVPNDRLGAMPSTTGRRRGRERGRRVLTPRRVRTIEGATLLLLGTVGAILMTLRPAAPRAGTICMLCGPYAGVDAILNVLLFIPIGAGLALLGLRWRNALLIGAAATVVIEVLQIALPLGRNASVVDALANAAGVAIGFYLAERRRALAYPRSRASLRYAITAGVAWLLVLTLSAALLMPSVPDGPYIAQWAPVVEGYDRYAGRVTAAHVSGVAISNGAVAESDRLGSGMRAGVTTEATIFAQGAPRRLAPVVRVVTEDSTEALMLAQRRDDLVFRSRVIGTALGLATPSVVMPDALSSRLASDRGALIVSGAREGGQLRAGAFGGEAILSLHAGSGWLLLAPSSRSVQASADVLSALWLGGPLFLAGYWMGRRARRRARRSGDTTRMSGASGQVLMAVPLLLALTIAGLAGVSALFGLSQPGLNVWLGTLAAIGLGLIVGATFALSHEARIPGASRPGATTSELPVPDLKAGRA